MPDLIKSENPARDVPANGDQGCVTLEHSAFRVIRLPVNWINLAVALSAGFALRVFFIIRFPFAAGDTKFYDALAQNWLYHGVYGLFVRGQLVPSDMRAPGYPAFLAAVYAFFGPSHRAIFIAQAVIGLLTCLGIASIAAHLAPAATQRKAATAALWIAALCPFTANYDSILLTEAFATFFASFALLIFISLLEHPFVAGPNSVSARNIFSFAGWVGAGGIVVGLGTLVRPEMPLVLAAAALIFTVRLRRRVDWPKLILTVSWMAMGLRSASAAVGGAKRSRIRAHPVSGPALRRNRGRFHSLWFLRLVANLDGAARTKLPVPLEARQCRYSDRESARFRLRFGARTQSRSPVAKHLQRRLDNVPSARSQI